MSVDYRAYEPSADLQGEVKERITSVYGSGEARLSSSRDELDRLDDGSVDVAVLCNVLHEIDPQVWLREIGSESTLLRKVAPEGFLMIVEDQRMPVGEKAHRLGFIVLHGTATRKLFGAREADKDLFEEARDDGRLTMFLVPQRLMSRVTVETRRQALEAVAAHAKEKIDAVRQESNDRHCVTYRDGRRHALFLQLFANARLALEEG